MNAQVLLREGKLDEAVQALGEELRENPADPRIRTFLFELLCFRGDYVRAGKHLNVLAAAGKDAAVGGLVYQGALHAEQLRADMFGKDEFPEPLAPEWSQVSGRLNGRPFQSLTDADERIGPRLEIFAGGDYMWAPFRHIASIEMKPPARLRDLLWAPAIVRLGRDSHQQDLGEVLLPVLSPLSFQHPDPEVRLGRRTEWASDSRQREIAFGQKVLLADGEEMPFLEIRSLEITQTAAVGL